MKLNLEGVLKVGSPAKGTAVLTSSDSFKVDEVRLELRIVEHYTAPERVRDSKGNYRTHNVTHEMLHHDQHIPIHGGCEVGKGAEMAFPFDVLVPRYISVHGGPLEYSLKAVAGVKGRPDVVAEFKKVGDA